MFVRRLWEREVFREMSKFMCVGFVNLTLSLIIFNISESRMRGAVPDVHLRLLLANTVAFIITTTTAFLMNSRITFKAYGAGRKEYVKYGMVSLCGLGWNYILMLSFDYLIAHVRHESVDQMVATFSLGKNVAYLTAVGLVFFWNFFMSRLWVFKKRDESVPPKTLVQNKR